MRLAASEVQILPLSATFKTLVNSNCILMPGIAGVIGSIGNQNFSTPVNAMIGTMMHEPFYKKTACFVSEMNVYAGAVTFENFTDGVFSNERGDISLIFSGECFVESENGTGDKLIQLYEKEGKKFLEKLNGLFCGLLIDKPSRKILLFNDRYGIQRIYFHEKEGHFYFASEAKALLRILPELRQFDSEGVADFLTYGCTLNWKTLFRGIEAIPGGSIWSFEDGRCRKEKYFSTATWESQPQLAEEEFESRFQETFKRILPRYFESPSKIGVALTGGLDTRMIMACRPQTNGHTTSYTFSGADGQTLDDKIAGRVAAAVGLDHQLLRLGPDFFSDFATHADKAVFITDGCAGIFNAHEPYFNRQARQLAPVRLTGNYGSEILRSMSTFKPIPLTSELLSADWRAKIDSRAQKLQRRLAQPMTFAAFKEIPWNLFGNLAAGRSQLHFRTPYLDNELVSLAFRAPERVRASSMPSIRLIRANDATLNEIPTDRGFAGKNSGLKFLCRRIFAETTFKLDYYNSEGLPGLLAPFEPVFKTITSGLGVRGLHKFLRYRSWFRNEFADYLRGILKGPRPHSNDFWNPNFVKTMASEHIEGRKNYSLEINAVLTLEAVERRLFRELPVHFN